MHYHQIIRDYRMSFSLSDFAVKLDSNEIEMIGELEPIDYFDGKIVVMDDDGDIVDEAGHFSFIKTRFELTDESVSMILDRDSSLDKYSFLYDEDGCFKEEIFELFPDAYGGNIFVLDRLCIYEKYTGLRLGLKILHHLLNKYGYDQLVVLQAFPLQHEACRREDQDVLEKMNLAKYSTNFDQSLNSLMGHYEKMGFESIPGTKGMMGLSVSQYREYPVEFAA